MDNIKLYKIVFNDDRSSEQFATLGEAIKYIGSQPKGVAVEIKKVWPRNRKRVLVHLLEARGLGHLKVWYRWNHPHGWMICETVNGEGYQRLGYTFAQAIEMIRSGTLEKLFRA